MMDAVAMSPPAFATVTRITHATRWAVACAALCLLSSCLGGAGQYQSQMGKGRPLYDEPTYVWHPSDGSTVPYCRWLPPRGVQTKGVIVAVPGMDEAAVEWTPLGRHLAQHGYEVYASDLRGQGRDFTHPQRGNYHRWQRWVQDVNEFAAQQRRGRKLPLAYVGQSLGCLVAMSAAAAAPPDTAPQALVLQAPALALAFPPWYGRPVAVMAQVLTLNQARITGPAAMQRSKTSIMSNLEDQQRWEASPDRLCDGFTYRYVSACLNVGHHTHGIPQRMQVPLLIQHGSNDKTYALSRRQPADLLASWKSADKELWTHPDSNASHDLVNDRKVRGPTLRKVTAWLDTHLMH